MGDKQGVADRAAPQADAAQEPEVKTAAQLNSWLRRRFLIFEAPPRAGFELFAMDGSVTMRMSREHVMAIWYGPEIECVEAALGCFSAALWSLDELKDASVQLFIRKWADYEPPHYELDLEGWETGATSPPNKYRLVPGRLVMRFCFWEEARHVRFPIKPDGFGISRLRPIG